MWRKMIKAVIFDCFGVIITDGLQVVMRELDKTNPEARAYIEPYLHRAMRGQISFQEYRQAVAKYLNIPAEDWSAEIKSHEYKDPKVMDLIKSLRPKYKTGMLSNVNKSGIERRFSPEELKECFDDVVVSAEVGLIKPNPEIYCLAAQRLGVDPKECVFIDDIERYCQAAAGVGMKAIYYQGFGQMKTELEEILAASSDN